MSIAGFQNVLQGAFTIYLAVSRQIGGDVANHSILVERAFEAQLQFLMLASESKTPSSQSEQMVLLRSTSQYINAIQDFKEMNRTSPFLNHLSVISESIPALGWVTVSPAPASYVKEMNDAGQFYSNRVLKDWKEKNKKHVDWVMAWIQTLSDLQMFVKQHHSTGLVWAGKNALYPEAGVPSLALLGDKSSALNSGNYCSVLLDPINQGDNIAHNVPSNNDPTLSTEPAPFKVMQSSAISDPASPAAAADKTAIFIRDGRKWLIEYQKGNHNMLVQNTEMDNVVYVYKCTDSTIVVKGKINLIILDSCQKTSIAFDSLVSAIEFINCQSVQMQVSGKVPTISVDKTDGCQIYLSYESLGVEINSSKSSQMNVLVPQSNGDYTEFPLPEQYKTTVSPAGLSTIALQSIG